MTVSFYVVSMDDKTEATRSSVKFGSMDKIGLGKDSGLTLMRTANKSTWDLRANLLKLGEDHLAKEGLVRFEPQLPYLYLPKAYYKSFTKTINSKWGKDICDAELNICKFEQPCEEVEKSKAPIDFYFRIYDESGSYAYQLPFSKLRIGGHNFGDLA